MASIPPIFPIDVADVGRFVFRKRRVPDQAWIEAEAERMTGGHTDNPNLRGVANAYKALERLTVEAPAGWDLEALDPLVVADTDKLWRVWGLLRDEEERFRAGVGADGAKPGA